jgi:hypothetical protein
MMQPGKKWAAFTFFPCPIRLSSPCSGAPPFPPKAQRRLVSYTNSDGTITNINLELAASVTRHDILVSHVDAREATNHNFSDNTSMF